MQIGLQIFFFLPCLLRQNSKLTQVRTEENANKKTDYPFQYIFAAVNRGHACIGDTWSEGYIFWFTKS